MIMQVQAEGLEASVKELQVRLQCAQEDLVLKRQTVEGLTHKFGNYLRVMMVAGPTRRSWDVVFEVTPHQVQVSC